MSVSSWSPDGQNETPSQANEITINPEWITRFISYGNSDELQNLATVLSDDDQQEMASIMRFSRQVWLTSLEPLDNQQLLALIRFFTCAEMQLSGWRAEEHSPVIAIAKLIRSRGEKLDRDLLLWIREHSDNRFLPYGSIQ